MGQATLFLMVGLPDSGKTTRAKELERETGAIPVYAGRVAPVPLWG